MKINNMHDSTRLESGLGRTTSKAATSGATGSIDASPPGKAVDITAAGAQRLSNAAGFDANKVEQIKEAIRNGQFRVDSQVVAQKLLSSVHELLGTAH